ncbi:hypothetical protein ACFLTD_03300 [Elusimicrobiota bacterium]
MVDANKRSYRRIKKELPEKKTEIAHHTYEEEDLRTIMSNWYHGQFTGIKTRNCSEEHLWGDLTTEQKMKLKRILGG